MDIASQYRHLFPVFEKVTYLNSCSQGALAIPVRDALNEYLDGMYRKGSLWDEWMMQYEKLRCLVAQTFRTLPSNVAITGNASAGINAVLSAFDFSGIKNRIVTTNLEFPTMGQILHAQELRGAEVVHVATDPDGTLDIDKLGAALDERVALVAITHVCYRTGTKIDVKAVSQRSHEHQIPVMVDIYQSAGSMPIDFEDMGADIVVGGFLKYMLGIPGVGFLLSKVDFLPLPTHTGWFAARDIFAMEPDMYDPAKDARRFEGGTPPIPSIFAAVEGLRIILSIGLEECWKKTLHVHENLRQELKLLRAVIVTPEDLNSHGAMIAFKSSDDGSLVLALDHERVVVSARGGNVRISPHFYNNDTDVELIAKALYKNRIYFTS
jgi:selenocysteine lyase/cysteine desulfurase